MSFSMADLLKGLNAGSNVIGTVEAVLPRLADAISGHANAIDASTGQTNTNNIATTDNTSAVVALTVAVNRNTDAQHALTDAVLKFVALAGK